MSSKRSDRLRPAVPPQRRDSDPFDGAAAPGTGAVDLRKRPRVDEPPAVSLRKRPRVELRKRPKVSLVKVRPPAGRPPLRQRVRSAARSTREWSRRPAGRMVLPGVVLLALIALATAAGMYIVPNTGSPVAREVPGDAASPSGDLPTGFDDDGLVAPPLPGGGVTRTGPSGTVPPGLSRPADALLSWAAAVSPRVGIPVPALQAYGVAELALAQSNPSCNLKWTTLAGIGKVESNHGSAQGARLGSDGRVSPPIIGLPLDGQGGRKRINDTDGGRLDADTVYDRAIGPMQFIPNTWNSYASDADGDLVRDPHDLDDAALAAGYYLCAGGRDLSTAAGWWAAVLSYNQVQAYADSVFTAANDYGQRSRV